MTHRAPLRIPATVAGIALVLVVGGGLLLRDSAFDLPLVEALNTLHRGVFAAIGDGVYRGVGPVPAIAATVILTGVIFAVRRDLATASTFAVTVAVTWLPAALIKVFVGRPRPDADALMHAPATQPDASYPSGHIVFATALVIAAVLVTRSVALRRVWILAGSAGTVLVAFCVVSDGLHFPTDAAASLIWAAGIAPFVGTFWRRIVVPRFKIFRQRQSNAMGPGSADRSR